MNLPQSVPCVPLPILPKESFTHEQEEAGGFGSLLTVRGNLPLEVLDVQSQIEGLVARTVMTQTFVNVHEEPLEATYIFPLPDQAAVTRFTMRIGERTIEAELQERGAARREYAKGLAKGHRVTIAEEDRAGVFTIRVGNIAPREVAVVTLTMTGPLEYSGGEATFRFPLVVAPRYIPGTPLGGTAAGRGTSVDTDQTPDASRITPPVLLPGFPNPVRLSMSVDISAATRATDLRSTLHSVREEMVNGATRITLRPHERLDRDFVLRYRLTDAGERSSFVVWPDEGGREGTFMLTVVPPAGVAATRPRDVVLLLDRSGSMAGWKMVAARRAVGRMIDSLGEEDRFLVIGFDTMLDIYGGQNAQLVQATNKERFRAIEFLSHLESAGGTEMLPALQRGVRALGDSRSADRDPVLVLITDGQVGNEDGILRSLAGDLAHIRTYTLGIDTAVNEAFLRRLAQEGGGWSEVVESEDRLDEVMDRMNRNIGAPVATDIRLSPAGFTLDRVVPRRMPDLFADRPLLLMGRYAGEPGLLRIHSLAGDGQERVIETTPLTASSEAIVSLWARGQVRALEDQYASSGNGDGALAKKIVDTSLRYGVLSRFTAYVGVDDSEVVQGHEDLFQTTQPVELPGGWAMPKSMAALSEVRHCPELVHDDMAFSADYAPWVCGTAQAYINEPGLTSPKPLVSHHAREAKRLSKNITKNLERGKRIALALLFVLDELEALLVNLNTEGSEFTPELAEVVVELRSIAVDAPDAAVEDLRDRVMMMLKWIAGEKVETTREGFWK